MSGDLRIAFAEDMPAAAVEVVSPSLEVVGRVMLAGGRAAVVPVPSEACFLRVHLPNGRVVTVRDDGNMERVVSSDLLRETRRVLASHSISRPSIATTFLRNQTLSGRERLEVTPIRVIELSQQSQARRVAPVAREAVVRLSAPDGVLLRSQSSNLEAGASWTLAARDDMSPLLLEAELTDGPLVVIRLPGNLRQVWTHQSRSSDDGSSSLSVRLASNEPTADTILGYLQRGDLYSAEAMVQWVEEAEGLLEDKRSDPYAAAVGGYLLLRLQRFDAMHDWCRNLADWFPFLPDGCAIWASQLIAQRRPGSEADIRRYLLQAASRGLPVFTEGLRLLLDGLRLIGVDGAAAREQLLQQAGAIEWRSPVTAMLQRRDNGPYRGPYGECRIDIAFGPVPGEMLYWPRLTVTDVDRADGNWVSAPPVERLRFLYEAEHARAQSVISQRQPGLVEALVRSQIHDPRWDPDFGRVLYQLLVPRDFEDVVHQLKRVALVVDATTANLPWEMVVARDHGRDVRPLALRAPVVRQFASSAFSHHVRNDIEHNALVIGNPSAAGFGHAFAAPGVTESIDPPPLAGAQAEAQAVASTLSSLGYHVDLAIGDHVDAMEVLSLLYRRPFRVLHISAHGVFDLLHRDGTRRSGVVLSHGLLITTAEIEAMDRVPELVFLNCCHLTKADNAGLDGTKLGANMARGLLEIGVRCVVVAGWVVEDAPATLFAAVFYERLLGDYLSFGESVFAARRSAWERHPASATWGAFQAYGDPAWHADPKTALSERSAIPPADDASGKLRPSHRSRPAS